MSIRKSVTVDVEVDVALSEFTSDELLKELQHRRVDWSSTDNHIGQLCLDADRFGWGAACENLREALVRDEILSLRHAQWVA